MKLIAYMEMMNKEVADASDELGVSPEGLRYWCNGQRMPSKDHMVSIFKWSSGHVTPNDFYDLPEIPALAGEHEGAGYSPLRLHGIREVKDAMANGMCAAGNGSAMPSQRDLSAASQTFAEVRP